MKKTKKKLYRKTIKKRPSFFLGSKRVHHFDGEGEDDGGVFLGCYGVQGLEVPGMGLGGWVFEEMGGMDGGWVGGCLRRWGEWGLGGWVFEEMGGMGVGWVGVWGDGGMDGGWVGG